MIGPTPWVELAETHSAVVFFVGERAYKLKKPVRFDFLDFSTPELREQALRRELSLNRRIAPDVYLGIAEVRGVDGAVCDHLLVMRRLPAERRLASLALLHEVTHEDLRAVARVVAAFHAAASRTSVVAAAGSPAAIRAKLDADLEELREFPADVLDQEGVEDVARLAARYVDGRGRLFDRRVAEGWVCDGHGDLLADDIFLMSDGPRVLDCLDFSDDLRYGDVLADVAFLAMDLERLGAPALAERFVDLYGELSGEHHPASLVDFYVAFRALIRAKVSALRHAQGDDRARATATTLLELARVRLRRSRVTLTVIGGAPGTGKSTVARGLADRQSWVLLRSDVVRKELAGLDPRAPAPAAFGAGLYAADSTERTYGELIDRARVALELGESVVIDASWSDTDHRAQVAALASETSSDFVELRCELDAAVADDRLRRRATRGGDASDADAGVAAAMRQRAAPWPTASVIDTSGSHDAAVDQAVAEVVDRHCGS
jgi:aminoglycoside phosphotransferase family enzyme/predicted kinase